MWLLSESKTRHLSLHGTAGHVARVACFACVPLTEASQLTRQCLRLCGGVSIDLRTPEIFTCGDRTDR